MIVRSAVRCTVLGAVLVLLGRTVGGIIVFRSGAAVQGAALRVDARVATLRETHDVVGIKERYHKHLDRECLHIDPPRHSWPDHRTRVPACRSNSDRPGCSCGHSDSDGANRQWMYGGGWSGVMMVVMVVLYVFCMFMYGLCAIERCEVC